MHGKASAESNVVNTSVNDVNLDALLVNFDQMDILEIFSNVEDQGKRWAETSTQYPSTSQCTGEREGSCIV